MENQQRGYNYSNIYTFMNKDYQYNFFLKKEWSENNHSYYTVNEIGTQETINDLINDMRLNFTQNYNQIIYKEY